jgi:hypothetical protein
VPLIQQGKGLNFCMSYVIRFKFHLTVTDNIIKIRHLIKPFSYKSLQFLMVMKIQIYFWSQNFVSENNLQRNNIQKNRLFLLWFYRVSISIILLLYLRRGLP